MKRKAFPWILVILWMALIFFFSHQPATESSELSSGITRKITDIIEVTAPNININQESLSHIIRKGAHFGVYLVLGILVTYAANHNNISRHKLILLAFLICILYAISDEIHQLYIPGRSGQVSDVLIDSTGGLVGIVFMSVIRRKHML